MHGICGTGLINYLLSQTFDLLVFFKQDLIHCLHLKHQALIHKLNILIRCPIECGKAFHIFPLGLEDALLDLELLVYLGLPKHVRLVILSDCVDFTLVISSHPDHSCLHIFYARCHEVELSLKTLDVGLLLNQKWLNGTKHVKISIGA